MRLGAENGGKKGVLQKTNFEIRGKPESERPRSKRPGENRAGSECEAGFKKKRERGMERGETKTPRGIKNCSENGLRGNEIKKIKNISQGAVKNGGSRENDLRGRKEENNLDGAKGKTMVGEKRITKKIHSQTHDWHKKKTLEKSGAFKKIKGEREKKDRGKDQQIAGRIAKAGYKNRQYKVSVSKAGGKNTQSRSQSSEKRKNKGERGKERWGGRRVEKGGNEDPAREKVTSGFDEKGREQKKGWFEGLDQFGFGSTR